MTSLDFYLKNELKKHFKLFFTEEANEIFNNVDFTIGSYEEIITKKLPGVSIPNDHQASDCFSDLYYVDFNSTQLTIWNRIRKPEGEGWLSFPNDEAPLWYFNDLGQIILAWDIYNNLISLLTLKEEHQIKDRDKHGRFLAKHSKRNKKLLKVPAFNEAACVLMAAAHTLTNGSQSKLEIQKLIRKPQLVISHDCDSLRGNDFWTQMVRVYRLIKPVSKGRLPDFTQLKWIWKNMIDPYKYYLDGCFQMIEDEKKFHFRSTFYFLNGKGGRFGARSGSSGIKQLVSRIPKGFSIGIHYNYDTYLNEGKFKNQIDTLEGLCEKKITIGRAHYLRFDAKSSPRFLSNMRIEIDESVGFPDAISYRSGIAGIYSPYDLASNEVIDVKLIPLVVMDSTLLQENPKDYLDQFNLLLQHISKVGGLVTLLVHPGWCYNPEFPESQFIYIELLKIAHKAGFLSITPEELLNT